MPPETIQPISQGANDILQYGGLGIAVLMAIGLLWMAFQVIMVLRNHNTIMDSVKDALQKNNSVLSAIIQNNTNLVQKILENQKRHEKILDNLYRDILSKPCIASKHDIAKAYNDKD